MLEQYAIWLALGCAGLAIVYGIFSAQWILRQNAGNERRVRAAVEQRVSHMLAAAGTP